jgi:hypothetical protein
MRLSHFPIPCIQLELAGDATCCLLVTSVQKEEPVPHTDEKKFNKTRHYICLLNGYEGREQVCVPLSVWNLRTIVLYLRTNYWQELIIGEQHSHVSSWCSFISGIDLSPLKTFFWTVFFFTVSPLKTIPYTEVNVCRSPILRDIWLIIASI